MLTQNRYISAMKKLAFLFFAPLFLVACATGSATEDGVSSSSEESVADVTEETRLADDVQEGEEWTDTPADGAQAPGMMVLTLETVAQNNSEESCWSIIDGSVYDLTDWISQHPGGASRILGLCGSDGTSQFQGQHGGSGSPESTLERYLLGALESN
jgi:cytochrome b involved in lipid metabolism